MKPNQPSGNYFGYCFLHSRRIIPDPNYPYYSTHTIQSIYLYARTRTMHPRNTGIFASYILPRWVTWVRSIWRRIEPNRVTVSGHPKPAREGHCLVTSNSSFVVPSNARFFVRLRPSPKIVDVVLTARPTILLDNRCIIVVRDYSA